MRKCTEGYAKYIKTDSWDQNSETEISIGQDQDQDRCQDKGQGSQDQDRNRDQDFPVSGSSRDEDPGLETTSLDAVTVEICRDHATHV